MADGDAVKNLEFTVRYAIREWDYYKDGPKYDWIRDDGRDSDELFDSIEDAEYDIKGRH